MDTQSRLFQLADGTTQYAFRVARGKVEAKMRTLGWAAAAILGAGAGCADGASKGLAFEGSCQELETCRGTISGNWTAQDACFDIPKRAFRKAFEGRACDDAFRRLTSNATGSCEFGTNGLAASNLTLTLEVELVLTRACRVALADGATDGVPLTCSTVEDFYFRGEGNGAKGSCSTGAGGAAGSPDHDCMCDVVFAPQGIPKSGSYRVEGDRFTHAGGSSAFCVAGDELSIEVHDTSSDIQGQLILGR